MEFALCSTAFFLILFGSIEFGRMLWTWNAASEATRYGARLAVVCDVNASIIKTKMQTMLPSLSTSNIVLSYLPGSCTASTCQTVTVTLTGYTFSSFIPFVSLQPTMPPFTTTLSREAMSSTSNPVCS